MTHFYHKQSRFVWMSFSLSIVIVQRASMKISLSFKLIELIGVIEFGYKKQILFVGNTS